MEANKMIHASTPSRGARLRAIFSSPETTLVPFGSMPYEAIMAEKLGFSAFQISGAATSSLYGYPDAGFLTMTEMVDHARRVARVVDIPVFCDADAGYGGMINMARATSEFIGAGVAGIHIEDQEEPKKSGAAAGRRLVSDAEAIGRLTAATDMRDRLDPDFAIVARTDARGAAGGSLKEAIRRGQLYREETGADVIFYEGLASWDECREALAATEGPAFCIASSATAGPTPPVAELSAMKQSINILRFAFPLSMYASWRLLSDVQRTGELAPVDRAFEEMDPNFDRNAFLVYSYDEVRQLEEKYTPDGARRDYLKSSGFGSATPR